MFFFARVPIFGVLCAASLNGCAGEKQDINLGANLGPAVSETGGSIGSGTKQVATGASAKYIEVCAQKALPLPVFDIVPVTQIVQATSGITGWTAADLPFTGGAVAIGSPVTDGQTPIQFNFTYSVNRNPGRPHEAIGNDRLTVWTPLLIADDATRF